MSNELEEWYSSINELLEDICSFLSKEFQNEKLSANARKRANSLIQRSKTQLQEMTRIVPQFTPNTDYVDMQQNTKEPAKETANIVEIQISEPVSKCPYSDLPAKDLMTETKYGYLCWKTRFLVHFEKMRNIFAGIHVDWFLIYSSDRDMKPLHTFNLRYCQAKSIEKDKQGKFDERIFELTYTVGKRKSYLFMAQTPKDMLQWVSRINNYGTIIIEQKVKPTIEEKEEEEGEEYDVILPFNSVENNNQTKEDDSEEAIYDDIVTLTSKQNVMLPSNKTLQKPPPLPPNRKNSPQPLISPQQPRPATKEEIKGHEDDFSVEYYDPVVEHFFSSTQSTENSFSEDDDEDMIYETFVDQKAEPVNMIPSAPSPNLKLNGTANSTTKKNVGKPVPPPLPPLLAINKQIGKGFVKVSDKITKIEQRKNIVENSKTSDEDDEQEIYSVLTS